MYAETPRLASGRVLLRELEPKDADGRRALGRDPEIVRMFGGSPSSDKQVAMSAEDAAAWYAEVSGDPNPFHWAIELEGRFVGTARLHALDEVDRGARYAVGLLDRDVLGKGVGTEVTRCVLRFAFEELGLHRVSLRVLAFNQRAIRCYLRCGFVEEGRERESAHIDGAWHDDVIMGILDRELRS